ncbi:MAG: fructose 1,6-bisphosphatase [Acidobacteria bacterium]|nr:fructose 1,6-bisphosphatase [Acidobacteriota bacterium]
MKTTLTAIKADIGSIGGHLAPSERIIKRVSEYIREKGSSLLSDYYVSYTGDDISILMVHQHGVSNEDVHRLAWEAFAAGTEVAREEGLYAAGQDLLKDAFSGNVKGLGPAVAEIEFEERPAEPFIFFAADKTDPGAYNLPLYLAFADPMHSSGLILSPKIGKGFTFVIMDVSCTEGDRVIELNAPEDLYDIAALLRDTSRYVIEEIRSRATGAKAVSVSTTRLRNIAGRYTGKDDPIMIVRVQGEFPASGEVLSPFALAHYVSGFMRGSHIGPLTPAKTGTCCSFFDGPPIVSALAFSLYRGKLTGPVDAFDHPFWDTVREEAARKSLEIRKQGFFGAAMLPYEDLEYGGIVDRLKKLEDRFKLRS